MKRLFPRAVPQALTALLLLASACNPSSNVQPGAPVLTKMSLFDPSGTWIDVTADTPNCATAAKEGDDCDPGTPICETGTNVVCRCQAKDMCDPTIDAGAAVTGGTLNCTFSPLTKVVATFDRLLDTAPFEATTMAPVATLMSDPATTIALSTAADYTSTGSPTGLIFTQFSILSQGALPDITGPTIALTGSPATPTNSLATFQLLKSTVLAKDGKTQFTGAMVLADGKIAFKTAAFAASIGTPAAPMDMSTPPTMAMGCPDAGAPMTDVDGGADAEADGGVDAAVASTDAAVATPVASPDVPSDMNTGAITIAFTNTVGTIPAPVGGTILDHITVTEDGVPFTDLLLPDPMKDLPAATLTIKPKTAWAPGKTYEVTVDGAAADVLGAPLGTAVKASFTMSVN